MFFSSELIILNIIEHATNIMTSGNTIVVSHAKCCSTAGYTTVVSRTKRCYTPGDISQDEVRKRSGVSKII